MAQEMIFEQCRFGSRVAACHHLPRCGYLISGTLPGEGPFGRYVTAAPCEGHATLTEHEAFLDHTAALIVAVATAAHPDDPEAAAAMALAAVDYAMAPAPAVLAIVPEGKCCGECEPAEYPMETETADEARDELMDQEQL